MEILGYFLALLIGFTMGLLGGGGSILSVPVLVYILGISPVLATAYSLFIVGVVASVGAVTNFKKGLVDLKTAIVFAVPSFIAVYLTRTFLLPAIPDTLITTESFVLTKDIALMIFFAIIMFAASISMIRKKSVPSLKKFREQKFNYPMILLDGFFVGTLTGIVGAGGGFLIIPALVLLARLPMKLAVGTSLTIIAIKSLIGFLGDIQTGQVIDWNFLLFFTLLAVGGIFIGGYVSNYIPGKKLKSGFGWFVLFMSIFILVKELLFNQ